MFSAIFYHLHGIVLKLEVEGYIHYIRQKVFFKDLTVSPADPPSSIAQLLISYSDNRWHGIQRQCTIFRTETYLISINFIYHNCDI